MSDAAASAAPGPRGAELAAMLCLATDLAMGFPFEHGLQSTLSAMRLADRLGVDAVVRRQTFYGSLLTYAGCTADAEVAATTFGGSLVTQLVPVLFGSSRDGIMGIVRALPDPDARRVTRAIHVAQRLPKAARERRPHLHAMCEVAEALARRLGLAADVRELFGFLTERWDGKGVLRRAAGQEIPLAVRIVQVARDATTQRLLGGEEQAVAIARDRAGHAFDPDVVACLADDPSVMAVDPTESVWHDTLACEPSPRCSLRPEQVDDAMTAVADFADLVSPCFTGHSRRVADLASTAAARYGMAAVDVSRVRWAGLVHDVGRVAVDAGVWLKPSRLTVDEWEQIRLHPYQTGRVLSRSVTYSGLAAVASAHHERLDGSGYHRGAAGADLPHNARLVAAADVYAALAAPRPHRPAMPPEEAARVLADEARGGRLDADAVHAVLDAAGHARPKIDRPAGLTDREAQVVRLLATGRQTKQVAQLLGISTKTADRHIQNAYCKIGVSSRAAATLFAMEHGVVAWSDLPPSRGRTG